MGTCTSSRKLENCFLSQAFHCIKLQGLPTVPPHWDTSQPISHLIEVPTDNMDIACKCLQVIKWVFRTKVPSAQDVLNLTRHLDQKKNKKQDNCDYFHLNQETYIPDNQTTLQNCLSTEAAQLVPRFFCLPAQHQVEAFLMCFHVTSRILILTSNFLNLPGKLCWR